MFNYANSNPYLSNYQQSNMNQQPQMQYPTTPMFFVNNINEARDYIMPLNSTLYFKDRDNNMLYIKSSDQMGRSIFKTYKLEEVDVNQNSKSFKQEEFVKISDFKALQEEFNSLKSLITKKDENKGVEQ